MELLEWATGPWGRAIPIHIAWFLMYVALGVGLSFLVAHAIYVKVAGQRQFFHEGTANATLQLPPRIPRHSMIARAFHWVMAASMLTLLITAFLPKVGVDFDWVTYHWIAGSVLTASVAFHIIHASFWLDFWAIWPDRTDVQDAARRVRRLFGFTGQAPRRFAKYPLDNKLYHAAIMLTGLTAIATGLFMLLRIRTIFFTRNPYLFGDLTWGWMYVMHGFAGVSLITLVIIHIYFAVRPEKLEITKSMIIGTMSREFYLAEHDPARWRVSSER